MARACSSSTAEAKTGRLLGHIAWDMARSKERLCLKRRRRVPEDHLGLSSSYIHMHTQMHTHMYMHTAASVGCWRWCVKQIGTLNTWNTQEMLGMRRWMLGGPSPFLLSHLVCIQQWCAGYFNMNWMFFILSDRKAEGHCWPDIFLP